MRDGINPRNALDALLAIDPGLPRDEWHRVGRAAIAAGLSVDDIDQWSSAAPNYAGSRDVRSAFRTITPEGGTGPGTLFRIAMDAGWKPPKGESSQRQQRMPSRADKQRQRPAQPQRGPAAAEVWRRCTQATEVHPYVQAKGGQADGLRVVPAGDPLRLRGEPMAGALVVPVYPDGDPGRDPLSLQFITPPEVAARLKARGEQTKLNLAGFTMGDGFHVVGVIEPGSVVQLVEGIGQAWACWRATGHAAVIAFGWGRVAKIARTLRQRDPEARLVLVPDAGKEDEAERIAAEVGGVVARMPEGSPANFDANDYAQAQGVDALEALLSEALAARTRLRLNVEFADELADTFTPPDELVQGVLTAGAGSVLYGDSNSGKTFFVIDMAAAVARGVEWMGRRTEQGLVVYLAAESPASVIGRLQAYQQYHGVKVPNFAIVKNPLDLYDGEADTAAVIATVRSIEQARGVKARLIVGDTLARLSAGANENSGEHMGLIVRRFDHIREATGAHFLLIHHSGKNAAAGARGWSGIRAAVDTEIEVTDQPDGRCAELTKQRDLGTKGQRIGFRLEPVQMGVTKWGAPASSCVVVPAEMPIRAPGKRMGEVEGAVAEFLATKKAGVKKVEVVKHFEGRYEKGPIYRAIKALVGVQVVHEAAGMVAIATAAK